jgi:ketosteroid isomerase-like protein
MSQAQKDFDEFIKQREEASYAFVNGDLGPLEKISVQASPATIFGPKGDCVKGAKHVNAANAKGAKHFKPGSKNAFEVFHKTSDGEIAYWVGIQHSVVQMEGEQKGVPMDLRVTEIFRREKGHWKLFHRHADPLKPDDAA